MAGGACGRAVGFRNKTRAERAAGYASSAPAVPSNAAASRLALLRARRCLSALLSGSRRSARVQRALRARISAERYGDRAAHELLLDARLTAGHHFANFQLEKNVRGNCRARRAFCSPAQSFSR